MNLLFRIVYAAHANGTHHKLALDALSHLKGVDTERWQRLFLAHSEVYLEGSKAPDKEFKDFKNHVLHVGDGFWGGAPEKAESWYNVLVTKLKEQSWHEAVYAAGILSHYYTDPIHPFHTAQSKAENDIHRAVEWSISKSYNEIAKRNARKTPPIIELGGDDTWIKDHVIAGAETSNAHYQTLIAHYNFEVGVVDPPAGLNEICKDVIGDLIVYAAVGYAGMLDRAFAEAGVTPPEVNLTAQSFIAALKTPLKWVTRKMEDAAERRQVEAMYDELQTDGRVEQTLSADDRQVRDLYQREVLDQRIAGRTSEREVRRAQSPLPQGDIPMLASARPQSAEPALARLKPVATAVPPAAAVAGAAKTDQVSATSDGVASQPLARLRDRVRGEKGAVSTRTGDEGAENAPRVYLMPSDDLEAAPSIGPKTAARFEAIGIRTVQEFLDATPETTAEAIDTRHISAKTIVEWQHQARLVCTLPGLRGGHAQLLVGAGLISVDAIAETDPADVSAAVLRFAQTSAGQSILRDGQPPDIEKIHGWVQNARQVNQAA